MLLMFKAIREWFANRNNLPATLLAELQSEGILLMREQTRAKLTYRDFKAPGKRFGYKTVWFKSTVAVTNKRILATVYGKMAIDVPFSDERIRKMQFSVEDGKLLVSLDASLFQPTWSGNLEYRMNLDDAQQYLDIIREKIA